MGIFFFFRCPIFFFILCPLTTLPLSMAPSFSLNLPVCTELKVDFICPLCESPQFFLRLCRSVLCGGDNGSNYTGSMSAPRHSGSSTGRLWHHDARCPATSTHTHTHSGESPLKGLAHCGAETQTTGNEMVFAYEVIESLWIFCAQ